MTNEQTLDQVYKKIAAFEMVEKLKNCGVIWNQMNTRQFVATIQQGSHVWDVFLTKDISRNRVILDFRRDLRFFFSINSDDEPIVWDMYKEIEGDEDFEKDRQLLRDIGKLRPGCFDTHNIIMNGGVKANSSARISVSFVVRGGITLSGEAEITGQLITRGGVKGGGLSEVISSETRFATGGAKAAGLAEAGETGTEPTSGGALAAGLSDAQAIIPIGGGARMAGTSQISTDVVAVGGARSNGSAHDALNQTQPIQSAGAIMAGTVIISSIGAVAGGVVAGGTARLIDSHTASGGAAAAGSATVRYVANHTVNGAVKELKTYFRMDELAFGGTIAYESSGNNNRGIYESVNFTSSMPSLLFDNYGSVIFDADMSSLLASFQNPPNLGAVWSISLWVKPTNNTGYQVLYSQNTSGPGLWLNNGYITWYNGGDILIGNTELSTSDWNHVVVTSNGSTIAAYLNGAFDGSANNMAMLPFFMPGIGGPGNGSGSEHLWGEMDEFRIYNRVLTADEITKLAAGQALLDDGAWISGQCEESVESGGGG